MATSHAVHPSCETPCLRTAPQDEVVDFFTRSKAGHDKVLDNVIHLIRSDRRFAVYRNNLAVGLVSALATRFPVVKRLVGDEFFRAMAHADASVDLPRPPLMMYYGVSGLYRGIRASRTDSLSRRHRPHRNGARACLPRR